MIGELSVLSEWIPEQMEPGTIFVLENAGEVGEKDDPYWAVLSCPSCGQLGLVTRKQIGGLLPVICGSEHVRRSSSFATNRSCPESQVKKLPVVHARCRLEQRTSIPWNGRGTDFDASRDQLDCAYSPGLNKIRGNSG